MVHDYIEFRRQRNFGDKLSATFEFIKSNYQQLLKILIYIPGPLILLNSIYYIFFIDSRIRSITSILEGDPLAYTTELVSYMLVYSIIALLLVVVFQLTILSFIKLYQTKRNGDISVNEVWTNVKANLLKLLSFYLLFSVTAFLFVGVLAFVAGSNGGFLGSMLIFIVFILFFYLIITFSLFPYVIIIEDKSLNDFLEVINRCFLLIRGKWWSTVGIVIISSLITSIIGGIFSIPVGLSQLSELFTEQSYGLPQLSISELVYSAFVQVLTNVLYIIPVTALAFQYYNLVERNEGTGLMQEIEDEQADSENKDSHEEDY